MRAMVVMAFMLVSAAWAGPVQDARSFAAGQSLPGVVSGTAVNGANVPGFQTSSPAAASYANNPAGLSGAAAAADPAGAAGFVRGSAASRPQFTITAQDPLVQGAQQVRANASALAGTGVGTSSAGGCRTVVTTVPAVVDTYTCVRSVYSQPVTQTLVLDRYAQAYRQAQDAYTRAWNAYQRNQGRACVRGKSVVIKGKCYCMLQLPVGGNSLCPLYYNGIPLYSVSGGTCNYLSSSSCVPSKKYKKKMAQAMQRMLDAIRAAQQARGAPPKRGCVYVGKQCLDSYGSITLNGQTVTPCWRWRETWQCPAGVDLCKPYVQAGCAQVSAQCVTQLPGGGCAEQRMQFQCTAQPARKVSQTVCGTVNVCVQGQCLNTASTPSTDFVASVARLMAAHAAGASVGNTNPPEIFKGYARNCNVTIFSFKNCCKQGTKGCPRGAQQLWGAMAARRTHYVGADCAVKDPIFGTCLRERRWYCVFGSKLARIVQEQGRAQLGIGWGAPPNPNCRGFTPSELQRLDFSRMDLSEFYGDVLAQMKSLQAGRLKSRIQQRLQTYYQGGAANGGLVR